ncbi:MAG: PIN domain-containing protein [Gemmataceae bacterium]|nr:PIN domain-containing protein [Gemmataceae bacterium]
MLVYLDICAIQRPHDDQSQVRVRVETAAVLGLLDHCRAGGTRLASSDALVYEAGRNPHPVRRAHAEAVLAGATAYQPLTAAVEKRADDLAAAGLRPLDALHLASAEAVGAAYLCTCDDLLLKRGSGLAAPPVRVLSPVELTTELGL